MDNDSVIATFTRRPDADRAGSRLRTELGAEVPVAVGETDDVLDALAVNQRAELGDAALAPSVSMWSGPMIRGGLSWGLAGLVIGALLALPLLALVDWPEDQRWTFVLAVAAAGALAASSAMFLIGAVRRAQREGEFTPEDPWAVVRVTPREGQAQIVIDILTDAGARSVRRVHGSVTRMSSDDVETPRTSRGPAPADDWPASQRGARSESA